MNWPRHPFPVTTVFRQCVLVNFALDPEALRRVLPRHIEPDIHRGAAWLSIVVGRMDRMRPVGCPRLFGITYDQVVYRAVVRCGTERGVHFLRSDADNRLMCFLGDRMSFFRFHHARVAFRTDASHVLHVDVQRTVSGPADIEASYGLGNAARMMPATSRFESLAEAQHWLVELFTAFDYNARLDAIDCVRIRRGEWNVAVVVDERGRYDFMQRGPIFDERNAELDSVFFVGDVPYRWHRLERRYLHGNR